MGKNAKNSRDCNQSYQQFLAPESSMKLHTNSQLSKVKHKLRSEKTEELHKLGISNRGDIKKALLATSTIGTKAPDQSF